MESGKRINWLGLFVKIIIAFIFILIIAWLISKIIGANKLSETFKSNINNMEKAAYDYFKTIDLPQEKGKSIKITLGEFIEKEIIVSQEKESKVVCDLEKSFSEIKREKNKYVIYTTLKCGKEKDTKKTNFSLNDCKNCKELESNKKEDNISNDANDGTIQSIVYYEYSKENISYTKWMRGNITGENIENKYQYYGIDNQTYYTLGVIPKSKDKITYTLKLNSVPNEKYYFMIVEDSSTYIKSDEEKYINQKDTNLDGLKTNIPTEISEYSFNDSHFTYKLSPYYRKGNFYVRVTINVKDTNGLKAYYDDKQKDDMYIVPLKINIKFKSDKIDDVKPEGNYETISYYRYINKEIETIWSTENHIEGYVKTGKTRSEQK